ncbi:response regulator [Acidipropionibacterium jensenii]|uniref:response regulator n=1 Tax=Acidipropionibacterium jensenii TaxID=1749 RepID=UPI0026488758|nr:response regulator transcription factor [Acidipropionibacterium jensenii]MDN5977846.1 response regulator transcription factor [Acidipropionibacterium jensenii]MDN5996812.1 response regulator transcription factor [Acidipropionibacterium jensenii]MDN6427132.1 response regulator transcription factor [Acidipropionibacterium jensenii]MDN6441641.1 response regulator transcription factor [Acidipropionibacterium jensenii]MDN6480745.1 response regulator transcription factor [Acidipropionibacterium j
MTIRAVRVGLCDDSAEARRLLVTCLSASEDLAVCGSYDSGPDAIEGVARDGIEVLLLDVRMPGMTGPEVAAELAASGSSCKAIYLTSYPEEVPVRGALRSTVRGALVKDVAPENLMRAILLVADGVSLLGEAFERLGEAREESPGDGWTGGPREQEVLRLVRAGATNAQIAAELGMSASWVKQAISKLCRRAHVRTRAGLAAFSGPVPVPDSEGN